VATRSKLSDTNLEIICAHVRQDMVPPEKAAASIGVTYPTFRGWLRRGEADHWGGKETAHSRFYCEVCRAVADVEIKTLKRLSRSTDRVESDNLKWMLERCDVATYGRQVTVQIRTEMKEELTVEILGKVHDALDGEDYAHENRSKDNLR